ncbi:hypothetical protein N665_0230s0052 [Sinapis alba]|nr:hypothetical protein N665_0230s0052 [Sinapis alba]
MEQPHALLVASPGLGHLIPILELGNRLSSLLNIRVTVLAVTSGSSSLSETEAIRAVVARGTCEVTELPSVDIDHFVEPDATVFTKIVEKMRATKPVVQDAIKLMKQKPTVMIVDFLGTDMMSIADDVGMGKYVYVASHAWFLAVMVYLPVLDKVVEGEYIDIKEPMKIPGCRPIGVDDLLETMLDRSNRHYRECVRCGEEMPMSDGILVNTWEELQGSTLAAFREDGELRRVMKVPVYAIGPIVRSNGPIKKPNSIFEWLDKQRERSVLYVCLGSGGTLSFEQTTELACGLEISGRSFLWVLRKPTSYLGESSNNDDLVNVGLPEGFLDRTRGIGLVVTQWAPQVEILSHGSVEQWMNATLLSEEIGVAVRTSELPSKRVIGREEVAFLVRKIMAEADEGGRKLRAKAEEVKVSSERAWTQGGSSHSSLLEWAKRCCLLS